jgi:trk system potassium uptake protein TrkH
MIALLNYVAVIGAFLSASLVLPAFVGFGTSDFDSGFTLLIYAVIGAFFSSAILMATRGRKINLDRVNSVYLAVLSWIIFPLVLAFPLADLFQISYLHAVFEAVSAFTTTAADSIDSLEAASPAAIFLRSNLQWTGGLAAILTFILFLGPIRAGGLPKPRSSAGEASGRTTSAVNRIAWRMFLYFFLATIICFVLLMLSGVDAFSSLILTSTAMTAGGYTPAGKTLVDIAPPFALIVMAVFFIIASTNVYWHRMVIKWQINNLKNHRESYYLIGLTGLLSFVFLIAIFRASGSTVVGPFQTVSEAIFNASSLISTSGLQSRPGIFLLITPSVVFLILLIGGGCFSMAGGIKLYRLGAMLFHSENELTKLIYPNVVTKSHFGAEIYNLRLMKSIWTMAAALIGTMVLGALALAFSGMSFQASITASIAAITNAGPAYSVDWVPRGTEGWPSYNEMIIPQKMILSIIMLLGRLEVIAVLVAINPTYWIKR